MLSWAVGHPQQPAYTNRVSVVGEKQLHSGCGAHGPTGCHCAQNTACEAPAGQLSGTLGGSLLHALQQRRSQLTSYHQEVFRELLHRVCPSGMPMEPAQHASPELLSGKHVARMHLLCMFDVDMQPQSAWARCCIACCAYCAAYLQLPCTLDLNMLIPTIALFGQASLPQQCMSSMQSKCRQGWAMFLGSTSRLEMCHSCRTGTAIVQCPAPCCAAATHLYHGQRCHDRCSARAQLLCTNDMHCCHAQHTCCMPVKVPALTISSPPCSCCASLTRTCCPSQSSS